MSDFSDVIYDPRLHTHTSCVREVENSDILVLIIGSRFGGTVVPKALESIDLEHIGDLSRIEKFPTNRENLSITQAEVLKAISSAIPIFTFIDIGVLRDHLTYEKNKSKPIISEIDFSSIEKRETAPYIFEFINFLRLRNENNSIYEFARFEDIEIQLKKQWAGLFQRLLEEQRSKLTDGRRIEDLSGQIADLKAAVLGSISNSELKETAKGAIRFRLLLDFVYSIAEQARPMQAYDLLRSNLDWNELLHELNIVEIKQDSSRGGRRLIVPGAILIREDGTHYRTQVSVRATSRLGREWEDFRALGSEAKEAIINAVLDSRDARPAAVVRYIPERYVAENSDEAGDGSNTEVSRTEDVAGLASASS